VGWGDLLVAEQGNAVIVLGALDRGERGGVEGLGQIDTADLGAERGTARDDLDEHGQSSWWSLRVV
jgi:hypothetical protein